MTAGSNVIENPVPGGDPAKVALSCREGSVSFEELGRRAGRVGALLESRAIGTGDRVAAMVRNGPSFFEISLGAANSGAQVVPVNYHLKPEELAWVVGDSGARLLVADAEFEAVAQVCMQTVGGCELLLLGSPGPSSLEMALPECGVPPKWEAPSYFFYTSGTTGRPRGVERQELGDHRRSLQALASMWGIRGDDVYLACSPLYHAANGYSWASLFQGATVVVMDRWDAYEWLASVERYRVTCCFMVPTHFVRLLEVPDEDWRRFDLSSLRLVLHAAAPCPVPVKRRILERLGHVAVWEFYGASEGGATRISREEWLERPGSVGRPWPGVEVLVLDEDGRRLGPGETGRVYIRPVSGGRFRYHNDPDKTESAWSEGAFTVGDVGHLDSEGYLYLTDRATDMAVRGGVNIYPAEVEAVLVDHPAVVDAAVYGVPDDRLGEELEAIVEVRRPVEPDELREHCRARLADFKVPRYVKIVDELPRDPLGKIAKRRLREERWRGRQTGIV